MKTNTKNWLPHLAAFVLAASLPWCFPSTTLEAGPTTCIGCKMTMEPMVAPPATTLRVQIVPMPGAEGDVNGECKVNGSDLCVPEKPCQITFLLSVMVLQDTQTIYTRFEDEFGANLGDGPVLSGEANGGSQVVEWATPLNSDCEGVNGASANVIFYTKDNENETVLAHYRIYCSQCDTIR